jgi:hypothetical protein
VRQLNKEGSTEQKVKRYGKLVRNCCKDGRVSCFLGNKAVEFDVRGACVPTAGAQQGGLQTIDHGSID